MRWLGPMLHLIYPPRHDAVAAEFVALLNRQQAAVAELSAVRVSMERIADRGSALDDLAGERG